ncbi:hypothetical protein A2U01_0119337, partial [Trifolium medium]|nr:hypothetical protein [Trifolium medium]
AVVAALEGCLGLVAADEEGFGCLQVMVVVNSKECEVNAKESE